MAERGRKVYMANGCIYCHSQQVRPDYGGADIIRKWGDRRSAPRDYIFDRPVLLGKMRMGPDLANIGKRAPAEEASPSPSPAAAATGAASPAPATTAAASPAPPAASSPAASPAAAPAAAAALPAAPAPTKAEVTPPPAAPMSGVPPLYSAAWHHRHLYAPRSLNIDSIMPAYRFLYEERLISGEPSADAMQLTGAYAPKQGWEIVPTYDAQMSGRLFDVA